MPQYKAPLRDIQFVMHELLNAEQHYDKIPAYAGTNRELIDGIIEAAADFCENELSPINHSGDQEGCHYDDGVVTTPKGFKEAYKKYIELGAYDAAREILADGEASFSDEQRQVADQLLNQIASS